MEEEEFKPVVRKKRNNRRNKYQVKEKTTADHVASLDEKRAALNKSEFMTHFTQALDDLELNKPDRFDRILCLALGAPTEWLNSYAAMHQLALLQLIADRYTIATDQIVAWDPVFEQADRDLLCELGIKVEEQYSLSNASTLLYMPHAPVNLANSMLQSIPDDLVIIGNNLSEHNITMTSAALQEKYPHLHQAIQSLESNHWKSISIPEKISAKQPYGEAVNGLTITKTQNYSNIHN